jgi:hypothetical protein
VLAVVPRRRARAGGDGGHPAVRPRRAAGRRGPRVTRATLAARAHPHSTSDSAGCRLGEGHDVGESVPARDLAAVGVGEPRVHGLPATTPRTRACMGPPYCCVHIAIGGNGREALRRRASAATRRPSTSGCVPLGGSHMSVYSSGVSLALSLRPHVASRASSPAPLPAPPASARRPLPRTRHEEDREGQAATCVSSFDPLRHSHRQHSMRCSRPPDASVGRRGTRPLLGSRRERRYHAGTSVTADFTFYARCSLQRVRRATSAVHGCRNQACPTYATQREHGR